VDNLVEQIPNSEDWILVRADALPEVFGKVLAVQTALSSGSCASVSEAVRQSGISRSAYYKYKDTVAPYIGGSVPNGYMTVDLILQDSPGVLSGLLSAFARVGANIVTVNQQPPSGGSAEVSICAKTESMSLPLDKFAMEVTHIPGVRRIRAIRRTAE
jgi:chorismate mutase